MKLQVDMSASRSCITITSEQDRRTIITALAKAENGWFVRTADHERWQNIGSKRIDWISALSRALRRLDKGT